MPDQTAVIAGVGPGLGAALARRFAGGGFKVGMFARQQKHTRPLEEELSEEVVRGFQVDVCDPERVRQGFAEVRETFGPVTVLVNHASAARWLGLMDLQPEDFELAWRTSAYGAFLCSREAVPDMLESGGGTILFTGATSAIRGRKGAPGFSSAKFAVRGLAQSLARELGPQGIHVAHIVIDGLIDKHRTGAPEKLQPDDIAETYWQLAQQPRSAWTLELDVRPHLEKF